VILNRLQHLAIQWKAKIWPEDELIAAIKETIGDGDWQIAKALNSTDNQRELYLRDVGLWRGADRKWRLIDQQPPSSRAQALTFITTRTHGRVCSFCRLADEAIELIDLGTYLIHPVCRRAWIRWTRAAMRTDPNAPGWWETLGVDRRTAGEKEIKAAYKRAAQKAHPDKKGGSTEAMERLNLAREEALRARA